jgi:hypothetical protein
MALIVLNVISNVKSEINCQGTPLAQRLVSSNLMHCLQLPTLLPRYALCSLAQVRAHLVLVCRECRNRDDLQLAHVPLVRFFVSPSRSTCSTFTCLGWPFGRGTSG